MKAYHTKEQVIIKLSKHEYRKEISSLQNKIYELLYAKERSKLCS